MKRILDPLDERIIAELRLNARAAHAELAAKVNLSRNAVRQRIERLERDGAIQRYTVRTGEGLDGSSQINAVIFVYSYERMRGAEVLQALRAMPEVIQCDVMSGEGIAQALATGIAAAQAILDHSTPSEVANAYDKAATHELLADHRMSSLLVSGLSSERGANMAIAIASYNDWTRRNFARWLFEDYPRALIATPRRWKRGAVSKPGAYRDR